MKTFSDINNCILTNLEAPCFKKLLPEEIELIKESKTQVLFRKGDSLTKQGAFASSILFVVDGLAKLYVESNADKNYTIKLVKSGEFVGLSAVFQKNVYNYSVVALKDTLACLIEKDAITNIVQHNGMFAFGLIKKYCEQNTDLYNTISSLLYKQMNGRLADVLLYLSSESFAGENVFSILSRKELAEFAGISTENVVKLLKGYEKDGIIKLTGRDIEIIDFKKLSELSKKG